MYYLPPLITAVLFLLLGLFVYFQNTQSRVNASFFLLCVTTFGWQFSWYILFAFPNVTPMSLLMRIGYSFIIFLPITYYHFLASFLNKSTQSKFIRTSYALGIFFLASLWLSNAFISGHYTFVWGYYPKANVLHPFYLILLIVLTIKGLIVLRKDLKISAGNIRHNQTKYVLIALLFYIPASADFIVNYGIGFYPFGFIFIAISLGIIGYAIARHHLMDIEVVIKRTLVFTTLFTIVFGIFVGITLLLQQFIGAGGNLIGFAVSSLIIILIVRPLEIFLVQITDKYLFQKKYDYKHLIREFMDELRTMVLNATDIAQSTIDFLNTSIRPANTAIFMYNKFTNKYDLIASDNFKDKDFKTTNDPSPLVKRLTETGKIININNDKLISSQERDRFALLGTELVIPLLIHKELIGILCLGKKKSDEDYAEDDIEALSNLSGALSISLNNAQLFDERADAEKRALVGTIATGINHEIGNPLNIITIRLDAFRILTKEGLMAHKTKEQIIDEVNEITKICLDSAQRIAEITKQVSEFAKPDKKLIFDKVNISETIDETMAFLKHGMILDTSKIEKKMICEPVYAMADRGQLKQILFNLLKNASHAVDKEKGKIIITVDKSGNEEVVIKIIDNGHGMTKQVMDKVFTPFFTTKEPGKGTGLGLALVKIMTDRNGGKIKVESQEGGGTTFTLIFKGGFL